MTKIPRKTVAVYGPKKRTVRVFLEGELCRVQWRDMGQLKTRSWPNSRAGIADAKAWAASYAEMREKLKVSIAPRLTLSRLWEMYVEAEYPHLRPRSQALYAENWRKWTDMWGEHTFAADATPAMIDTFRRRMSETGRSVSYQRAIVHTVRRVYRWAEQRELLERNRLEGYRFKVPKDQRTTRLPEYSAVEFRALIATLNPESATQWRAWVALMLCERQGARQHAVLHLQWADILEDRIIWRAAWDKVGNQWEQPLRKGTPEVLAVARRWRERIGYDGPWVLPSGSRKSQEATYTIQSLWAALRAAERRSGVERKRGRAGHGLRRKLTTDANRATGNAVLAMRMVGDRDVRQAEAYIQDRIDDMRDAFAAMDRIEAAEAEAEESKRNQTATNEGGPDEPPSKDPPKS
jgi:site-specific recombinase XerD